MPGPWMTHAELKQVLANTLSKDVNDLDARWDEFVALGLIDSTADITGTLLGKGFDISQVDAWDNRLTYARDIGLYFTLLKGSMLAEYDQTALDKLDRRKMLEDASSIMINGKIVSPADTDTGAGASGGVIDDSCYRFNMNTKF